MVGTKPENPTHADMAKLADAQRLGRCYRKVVLVQVQLSAHVALDLMRRAGKMTTHYPATNALSLIVEQTAYTR